MAIISRGFIRLTHGKRFQNTHPGSWQINENGDLFNSGALKTKSTCLKCCKFYAKEMASVTIFKNILLYLSESRGCPLKIPSHREIQCDLLPFIYNRLGFLYQFDQLVRPISLTSITSLFSETECTIIEDAFRPPLQPQCKFITLI